MYSEITALALVSLLNFISTVQCIECYQCTSVDKNPNNCIYPNDKLMVDCSNSSAADMSYFETLSKHQRWEPPPANALYYCAKLIMSDGDSSKNIVIRGCVKEGVMNETCQERVRIATTHYGQVEAALANRKIKYCSTCNYDRCNAAARIASSVALAVGAVILSYLAYH